MEDLMSVLDRREQAFEQGFAHDEDVHFRILAHRNQLFGRWAAEQLGYRADVADRYVQRVVEALCEPFDGITQPDDKVVSRIGLDLGIAGWTLSQEEVRGVLMECEARAKTEIEGGAKPDTPERC
jgi:hypothetical protein